MYRRMSDDAVALCSPVNTIQKMEYMEGGVDASAPLGPAPDTPASAAPIPLLLGPKKAVTTCPFCKCAVKTTIQYTTTTRTHRLSFLYSCCFCCCLPFCMTSTRNTDHYCPNCSKYLGTYKK